MNSIIPVILSLFVSTFVVGHQEIFSRNVESCHLYRDVTKDYLDSIYEFTVQAYMDVGPRSSYHFTFSPLSVWIILAAMAEGADPHTQQQMFRLLRLPNDPCVRLRFYQIATSRYQPGNDVNIVSTRSLVVDQGLALNPYWHNFVSKNRLINVASTPLRYDPQGSLKAIRLLSSATLANLDLSGNSVLVDTMDFNGLWTTAFSDAVIQRSPFYDPFGQKIGAVDLMRVSRRAKVAFVSSINAKVLELPIGVDDRYRMLFVLILDTRNIDSTVKAVKGTTIFEYLSKTQESFGPVDIAIPRITMTSEIDVRSILENLGVTSLWTDPAVTRYISDPAALPSGFVQRCTITLNKHGISPAPYVYETPYNVSTGLESVLGSDFTANRPFLFGVVDTETYTVLVTSIYSQPTYRY